MAKPKFEHIKLADKTSKEFAEPKDRAIIREIRVSPKTEEEAHDLQDKEGRLEKEQVPIKRKRHTTRRKKGD